MMKRAGETIQEYMARVAQETQTKNPNDYTIEDGVLVCGACHKPKRKFIEVATPTDENPNMISKIMVTTNCDCGKREAEAKERERQMEEHQQTMRRLRNGSLMDTRFEKSTLYSNSI